MGSDSASSGSHVVSLLRAGRTGATPGSRWAPPGPAGSRRVPPGPAGSRRVPRRREPRDAARRAPAAQRRDPEAGNSRFARRVPPQDRPDRRSAPDRVARRRPLAAQGEVGRQNENCCPEASHGLPESSPRSPGTRWPSSSRGGPLNHCRTHLFSHTLTFMLRGGCERADHDLFVVTERRPQVRICLPCGRGPLPEARTDPQTTKCAPQWPAEPPRFTRRRTKRALRWPGSAWQTAADSGTIPPRIGIRLRSGAHGNPPHEA